jgi:hypothetical protein
MYWPSLPVTPAIYSDALKFNRKKEAAPKEDVQKQKDVEKPAAGGSKGSQKEDFKHIIKEPLQEEPPPPSDIVLVIVDNEKYPDEDLSKILPERPQEVDEVGMVYNIVGDDFTDAPETDAHRPTHGPTIHISESTIWEHPKNKNQNGPVSSPSMNQIPLSKAKAEDQICSTGTRHVYLIEDKRVDNMDVKNMPVVLQAHPAQVFYADDGPIVEPDEKYVLFGESVQGCPRIYIGC